MVIDLITVCLLGWDHAANERENMVHTCPGRGWGCSICWEFGVDQWRYYLFINSQYSLLTSSCCCLVTPRYSNTLVNLGDKMTLYPIEKSMAASSRRLQCSKDIKQTHRNAGGDATAAGASRRRSPQERYRSWKIPFQKHGKGDILVAKFLVAKLVLYPRQIQNT